MFIATIFNNQHSADTGQSEQNLVLHRLEYANYLVNAFLQGARIPKFCNEILPIDMLSAAPILLNSLFSFTFSVNVELLKG